MKEIKFTPEMVELILTGAKTQTRRPLKPQPPSNTEYFHYLSGLHGFGDEWKRRGILNTWSFFIADGMDSWPCSDEQKITCPYGHIGNRLLIRDSNGDMECGEIEITNVRVQRLQAIMESDCAAELGLSQFTREHKEPKFISLWGGIYGNGEHSWSKDPWVWALDFKLV